MYLLHSLDGKRTNGFLRTRGDPTKVRKRAHPILLQTQHLKKQVSPLNGSFSNFLITTLVTIKLAQATCYKHTLCYLNSKFPYPRVTSTENPPRLISKYI